MFVIMFVGVTSTTATTNTTTSGFGPSSNTTSWFGHTLLRHFVARQHRGRAFIKHEFVCEVQGHRRCSSRRCASTHLGILARRAHELGTQQGIAGRICRSCPGMASNLRCRWWWFHCFGGRLHILQVTPYFTCSVPDRCNHVAGWLFPWLRQLGGVRNIVH